MRHPITRRVHCALNAHIFSLSARVTTLKNCCVYFS